MVEEERGGKKGSTRRGEGRRAIEPLEATDGRRANI